MPYEGVRIDTTFLRHRGRPRGETSPFLPRTALDRLPLPVPPAVYVPSRMESSGVRGLPVEHRHALATAALPPHHHDPFDRLLVAQAGVEGLTLLTADPQLAAYDVALLRAG